MATWVTHLIIADNILQHYPQLHRRGFCIGNIAPDCNIENEDWTAFTPPREVTHWMHDSGKTISGCEDFREAYIETHTPRDYRVESYAFLLGYYSHLLTDVAFQQFIRDEIRVKNAWKRLKSSSVLSDLKITYPEDWDSLKKIIPKDVRMGEIYSMEAEYLQEHPNSGFFTEVLSLNTFPDYIDYLPAGCIARKIRIMGHLPKTDNQYSQPISLSKDEFHSFIRTTTHLVLSKLAENHLI